MLFRMGARHNGYLVARKTDPEKRIGRVELMVSEGLVRVRWRGGVLEDRVPINELTIIQARFYEEDDAG